MKEAEEKEKNKDQEMTTLWVRKTTRERLYSLGEKGETTDQLINRLLDVLEPKG